MQRMTLSPASIAARVFVATRAESSWKSVRRSEWPIQCQKQVRSKMILRTENNIRNFSIDQLFWAEKGIRL